LSSLFFFLFPLANLFSLLFFELSFFFVKLLFGLSQALKAISLLPEFLRELVTPILWAVLFVFFSVNFRCLVKDFSDLLVEFLACAICIESSIALDAPAVQGDLSEVSEPSFSTQTEDLFEEVFEVISMVFAKLVDRTEVWLLISCKIAKRNISFKQSSEFSGASHTDRVSEDQDFQHHRRVEGRPPAAVLVRIWIEWFQSTFLIQEVDRIRDESFETVLFNPLRDVFWKQVLLILVVFNKVMSYCCMLYTERILDTKIYDVYAKPVLELIFELL
jgi:hypothetical protein